MPIVVKIETCNSCETCIESCPFDAIVLKDGKAFINEYCNACTTCLTVCPEGAIIDKPDTTARPAAATANLADYKDVMIFAEQRHGEVASVSYELLGEGRRLAEQLDAKLIVVLLGADEAAAQDLIRWGADKVILNTDKSYEQFNDDVYSEALYNIIEEYKPSIVLAGASAIGRSFIPRVAARLRTGLTADCTSLKIEPETRCLLQVRPAFGGNIMATIVCPDYRPQMATVRSKVMKKGKYDETRTGEIIKLSGAAISSATSVIEFVKEVSELSVDLHAAEVIVAGGRGAGEKGFKLLAELADVMGGVVGASRSAVDEGWVPYCHQVGQTGTTVTPKIYIACGISGAVQHLVGMQSSDIIIAINKNPEAPIFNVATYGIVGNMFDIVPQLISSIRNIKEN